MSKKIKRAITILAITLLVILVIISSFFIVKYINEKNKIETVCKTYSEANIQSRLEKQDTAKADEMLLKIDGENVIGVIQIDKIKYKGLIYEGTSLNTLAKGVGHFENSSYLNGNVCLAAHNTNKFWAKLHTVENGDKITYVSFLGTKEYEVFSVSQILETDWTLLESTDENILTLITCIKGQREKRLCVQAREIN